MSISAPSGIVAQTVQPLGSVTLPPGTVTAIIGGIPITLNQQLAPQVGQLSAAVLLNTGVI